MVTISIIIFKHVINTESQRSNAYIITTYVFMLQLRTSLQSYEEKHPTYAEGSVLITSKKQIMSPYLFARCTTKLTGKLCCPKSKVKNNVNYKKI